MTTLEADWRLGRPQGSPLKAPLFPRIKGRDDGHALSGPIYVEGARSGMALKVEIAEIVTENWGWSSVGIGNRDHLNRLGFSGEEDFRVWDLDVHRGICQGPDGMTVPLSPFPGVVAVAPEGEGPVRTHIPGNHGGNLDCRALTAGSTVYLPVFHPGALFSVGDGHGAQGDGESGGTAVECPFRSISLRLSAVDYLIKSPVAHTAEGWMTFGFHEDLTVAAYEALRNMRLLLKYGGNGCNHILQRRSRPAGDADCQRDTRSSRGCAGPDLGYTGEMTGSAKPGEWDCGLLTGTLAKEFSMEV